MNEGWGKYYYSYYLTSDDCLLKRADKCEEGQTL